MTPFAGGKPWVFLKGCSASSNFAKMQCMPVLKAMDPLLFRRIVQRA